MQIELRKAIHAVGPPAKSEHLSKTLEMPFVPTVGTEILGPGNTKDKVRGVLWDPFRQVAVCTVDPDLLGTWEPEVYDWHLKAGWRRCDY